MATKDQEREALKQILKIVTDLGEGSYLEMTFKGIFQQAVENIDNDWACNYKDSYEDAKHANAILTNEIEKLKAEKKDLQEQIKTLTGFHEAKMARIDELNKQLNEAADDIGQYEDQIHAAKTENGALKAEIVTLKAKLYDLMSA